jgi:DNA invertase Pin-like site-specific DNA recombinase
MPTCRLLPDPSRAVAYVRVSTEEQSVSGLGLEAQEAAIRRAAEARGCAVVAIFADAGVSGSVPPEARAGLTAALAAVRAGAGTLIVAKLDRLSRSLLDFAGLMQLSRREGWGLVALDLAVDTSTPQGEMMAHVMATFAQFERRLIGQRTRDALAVKRAQGSRLGRPIELPEGVRCRVVDLRASGLSMAAVAKALTAEGVPTARGGRWAPGTVLAVLRSVALDREPAA